LQQYNDTKFAVHGSEQKIQKTAFTIRLFFPTKSVKVTAN